MDSSKNIQRMLCNCMILLTFWVAGPRIATSTDLQSKAIALYDGDIVPNQNRRYMTAMISNDSTNPEFGLNLWQGECRFDVDLTGNSPAVTEDVGRWRQSVSNDTAVVANDAIVHRFYRNKSGLEWEVVLLRRPDSNVFVFDLETCNLTFHYQDSLSEFERDSLRAVRPDSVVGAWVAYHASRNGDFRIAAGENSSYRRYGTGQAFVIYRPRARDSNDTTWCDLNVDIGQGKLRISVDETWLMSADYPVTVDPTFGNTSIGASSMAWNQLYAYCHRLTGSNTYIVPQGKTASIEQYSIYGSETGAGDMMVNMASYDIVNGVPVSRVVGAVSVNISGGTPTWFSSSTLDYQLNTGSEYGVAIGCAPRDGGTIYYNNISNSTSTDNAHCTLDSQDWSQASQTAFNFSMYATYSEEDIAGEVVTGRRKRMTGHKE